ncbi:type I-E CRISPR-associated protein Cas6/Cse3/CasE [Streptomyces albipurpureus]|uniref:Type I-E CRISPR-associated protein Cas6/Cse3/CasE n=1 Tax=Streptomyces albipurpureus TaxID=2897419 RepID=A0ABT0UFI3_9ACTN|nr:type I-E CRISPR-associated protein Cas6/Cse3/CasE [Streptomyces sp. CWNU-1]MCM2387149.1 type I-E CRISPR-associated protein Cas6/Cse3/CasE [Streptomyces sp. CWNU-1]
MTLWLTRIVPSPSSREARRDLGGSDQGIRLHQRMLQMFPDGVEGPARAAFGVLFRAEESPHGPQILLQSHLEPDSSRLPGSYGSVETRCLDALLLNLHKGMVVNYRCVANPVRKPGTTSREAYGLPPVVALSGNAAVEWWERQSNASGLEALHINAHPLAAVRGHQGSKGPAAKQRIQHARTQFDGTARVLDVELLREKLATGIGRGKAYGCGLLSIAPAR